MPCVGTVTYLSSALTLWFILLLPLNRGFGTWKKHCLLPSGIKCKDSYGFIIYPFFVVEIHQFWEVQISISYHPMTSIANLNSGEGAPLVVRSLRAGGILCPSVHQCIQMRKLLQFGNIFLFGCVLVEELTERFLKRFFFGMIWMFPKIGVPQNGWFIMEKLLKWMIWGYHYFWKHPYGYPRIKRFFQRIQTEPQDTESPDRARSYQNRA